MIHITAIGETFVYSQKQIKNQLRTSFAGEKRFITKIDYIICSLGLLQIKSEAFQSSNLSCNVFLWLWGSGLLFNMYSVELLPAALTWHKWCSFTIAQRQINLV